MNEYLQVITETGLVEFGLFKVNGRETPIRFNWEYLPAFPDVLSNLSYAVQPVLKRFRVDQLLVPNTALPLGIALSLQTNIPLIYDMVQNRAASHLLGAFDSGQTALLVTYDCNNIESLIWRARQVGLRPIAAFSVMKMFDVQMFDKDIPWHFAFDLSDAIQELTETGQLSIGQAQAIYDWIAQHEGKTIPHPDSAVP